MKNLGWGLVLILLGSFGSFEAQSRLNNEKEALQEDLQQLQEAIKQQEKIIKRLKTRHDSALYLDAEKELLFLEILYDELAWQLAEEQKKTKRLPHKKTSKTESSPPLARAWLGVSVEKIPDGLRKIVGLPENEGVFIQEVKSSSPAEAAGLQKLDIILSYDGEIIRSTSQLGGVVRQKKPNETLLLKVIQKGKTVEIPVVLGAQKAPISPKNTEATPQDELETFLEDVFEDIEMPEKKTKNLSKNSKNSRNSKNSKKVNTSKKTSVDVLEEFTESKDYSKPSKNQGTLFQDLLEDFSKDPESQKALLDSAEDNLTRVFGNKNKKWVKQFRKQTESFLEESENTEKLLENSQAFMQQFLGEDGELHEDLQGFLQELFGSQWEDRVQRSLENATEGDAFDAEYFFEQLLEENPEQFQKLLEKIPDQKSSRGIRKFFERTLDKASQRQEKKQKLHEDVDALFDELLEDTFSEESNSGTKAEKTPSFPKKEESIKEIPVEENPPLAQENVAKPYVGFKLYPLSPVLRAQLDINETDGVLIGEVEEASPAEFAGLVRGDVLLKINNTSIQGVGDVSRILRVAQIQEELELVLNRKGNLLTLRLVVGSKNKE